ncbi:MAG: hypothetical protein WAO00_09665 [Chthoniobacterales bacterium]
MIQNPDKVDLEALKDLYAKNSVAKAAFDYLATRQRNRSETTVNQLLADLVARGHQASYVEVRDFLRALARLNCGVYIIGRKRRPSRLRWRVGRVSLGKAAAGQLDQVELLTEEEVAGANDEAEEGAIAILNPEDMKLTYPLRRDRHIDLIIPRDITPTEAQRLSDFIKTLQFE